MTTYNESGLTYNETGLTWDGYQLTGDAELLLDGVGAVEIEYAGPKLTARVDDSLGTLDARLIDLVPSLGQQATVYLNGTTLLWDGVIASVESDEFLGGHTFSEISAQAPAWPGGTPTASAWDLSDTPNLSTTFPYVKLSERKYLQDGVQITGYTVVVDKPGLWVNQTIELTSANFGLSSVTFLIVEVNLEWQTPDAPRYTLLLDVSQPQLPELIADQAAAVVATSTPSTLQNVPATVTINEDGLLITDGQLEVRNVEGTVIIDGSSEVFDILAQGVITLTGCNGSASECTVTGSVNVQTGLDSIPAHLGFLGLSGRVENLPRIVAGDVGGNGTILDVMRQFTENMGGGLTKLTISWQTWADRSTNTYDFHWYILKQVPF